MSRFKGFQTVFIGLLIFLNPLQIFSQEAFILSSEEQSFKVLGTSTLHDWHMESSSATGQCSITLKDGSIVSFNTASISIPAETLKSGKRGMDKNAYKALDTKEHESIQFTLSKYIMESETAGKATGKLTIAGYTRDVTFNIEVKKTDSAFTIKGTTDFNLTDFQIEPPKALMGTIKTGDAVTIEFNSTFKNL